MHCFSRRSCWAPSVAVAFNTGISIGALGLFSRSCFHLASSHPAFPGLSAAGNYDTLQLNLQASTVQPKSHRPRSQAPRSAVRPWPGSAGCVRSFAAPPVPPNRQRGVAPAECGVKIVR